MKNVVTKPMIDANHLSKTPTTQRKESFFETNRPGNAKSCVCVDKTYLSNSRFPDQTRIILPPSYQRPQTTPNLIIPSVHDIQFPIHGVLGEIDPQFLQRRCGGGFGIPPRDQFVGIVRIVQICQQRFAKFRFGKVGGVASEEAEDYRVCSRGVPVRFVRDILPVVQQRQQHVFRIDRFAGELIGNPPAVRTHVSTRT